MPRHPGREIVSVALEFGTYFLDSQNSLYCMGFSYKGGVLFFFRVVLKGKPFGNGKKMKNENFEKLWNM